MTRIITAIFLSIIFLTSNAFSNERPLKRYTPEKDNGTVNHTSKIIYGDANLRGSTPFGTVPTGMTGFFDYVTNGNSIRDIYVLGDTIICSWVLSDSTDPLGATTRVAYYTVSVDNGATWLAAPLPLTTGRSAYPDITPFIGGAGRNVVLNGRSYAPGTLGATFTDAFFGLGSFTSVLVPNAGRDYFAYKIAGTKIGGAYLNTTDDTIRYVDFDYIAGTMGTSKVVGSGASEIGVSGRQFVSASDDGNHVTVMWWFNNAGGPTAMNYVQSTDAGATFGSIDSWVTTNETYNGDSIAVWFGADVIYKPGTQTVCAATNTLGFSGGAPNFGTREGYKLLFWSPTVNGGTPTVIADRTNFPTLSDTNQFNQLVDIQVGATAVSHPSLAYSDDGSMLFCVYSGVQTDTMDLFNFNDIYLSTSTNDGATWNPPINITNTADWDEMYPSIAKTGNTTNKINIVFQSTRGPGSQSFTDAAPTYRVWQSYAKINPQTGAVINVNNISSEIPSGFSLKQNYPNPFNPSTTIRFDIPRASKVTLKVYDINGREVATLVKNENVSAGLNEVSFNGSNFASGVYYYTLLAGDFKETRKMVLIK